MNPIYDPTCAFLLVFAMGMGVIACLVVWNILRVVGVMAAEALDWAFCKLFGIEDDEYEDILQHLSNATGVQYEQLLASIDGESEAGQALLRVLTPNRPG